MKMHRFIGTFDIEMGQISVDSLELFNQIHNVLKLKVGQEVLLCDGNIHEGRAIIREFKKPHVIFEIIETQENSNEPEKDVILFCAVLKKENFELICQKATEIGVSQIIPIITDHTVKLGLQSERIKKIMKEAAEQSGRGKVPQYQDPISFDQAVIEATSLEENVYCSLHGSPFGQITKKCIGIWIGPEGGWSAREEDVAKENNFSIKSLGKRTLRGETAAIVATYLVVADN